MIRGFPNPETGHSKTMSTLGNERGEPAEVKHLSKRRKRERSLLPEYWRRKRQEPKLILCFAQGEGCKGISFGAFVIDTNTSKGDYLGKVLLIECPWKGQPKKVIVL